MLIGIDISTTGAKAILMNLQGKVVAVGTHAYPLSTPNPLWSEQNPQDWWGSTIICLQDIFNQSGINPKNIHGIGLTGQMHGLVLLDQQNQILRPAILWNDQRTEKACQSLVEMIGETTLINITGNTAMTGFTAPKLLWVKENEPEIYRQIAHILLPKDYIRFMLTGSYATDCADASGTLFLEIKKRQWSQEILNALNINPKWLPMLHEGVDITGYVSEEAAKITGLSPGTPVVGGGGDQATQAVGAGAVEPGIIALTLGTSGVIFAPTHKPSIDLQGRLHAMCHCIPPKDSQGWHLMGVMLSAAGSLRWFRDTFFPSKDYAKLVAEVEQIKPGSDGLIFLPYLTGERTPYADPNARGSFIGLTIRHKTPHMTRAILEGVAFGLRDIMSLITKIHLGKIQEVRISGGGAESQLWRQIIADILDVSLVSVNTTEGACYGAALLAGVGTGVWPTVKEACWATIKKLTTTNPSAENVPIYQGFYQEYQHLYPVLKDTFKALTNKSK